MAGVDYLLPNGEKPSARSRDVAQTEKGDADTALNATNEGTASLDSSNTNGGNNSIPSEKVNQSEKVDLPQNLAGATAQASDPGQKKGLESKELAFEDGDLSDDSQDSVNLDTTITLDEGMEFLPSTRAASKKRAPKRIKQFGQFLRDIHFRFENLEQEVAKLRPQDPDQQGEPKMMEPPLPLPDPIPLPEASFKPKIIPSIQHMDWSAFKRLPSKPQPVKKSEFSDIDKEHEMNSAEQRTDQEYVIEILTEDPGIMQRRPMRRHTNKGSPPRDTSPASNLKSSGQMVTESSEIQTIPCPERIRIRSKPLLALIGKVTESSVSLDWDVPALVFLRPFKLFVSYESEFRKALSELEKKWEGQGEGHAPEDGSASENQHAAANKEIKPAAQAAEGANQSNTEPETEQTSTTETSEALQHLRLLLKVFDTDLKSTFELREKIKKSQPCAIAFGDLWHLFDYDQEIRTSDYRLQVYRVAKFTGGRDTLVKQLSSSQPAVPITCLEREISGGAFYIECFRYDFDGTQYGPVQENFAIRRYSGEKDITTLPVYPWSFDKDVPRTKELLARRGEKFVALSRSDELGHGAHRAYSGLDLGEHPEEIESEIIIDFQLAMLKDRALKPTIGFQTQLEFDPRELSDATNCIPGCCGNERYQDDHQIDAKRSTEFLNRTKHILEPVEDSKDIEDEDRYLLPYYVPGFVLRSRKWTKFDIDEVKEIEPRSGFDDLVLPGDHKETLQALVNTHSRGKDVTVDDTKPSMDLVKGKGKGLIILLHGMPGVGKTSTAECVAENTRRPLFPITCGNLGESANKVEENLEKNFQMAFRWGCVLLLDEADVFLNERNQQDLQRNAIVSVFLRTLEYYSGILFLTTNRVGTLDPAFKSRIHISLFYPSLDRAVTTKIWKNHLAKAKKHFKEQKRPFKIDQKKIMAFCRDHFKELRREKQVSWNGRQIRNAFQTAIALAEWEAQTRNGTPELSDTQFKKIADLTKDFDRYLLSTKKYDDSTIAIANKLRNDKFGQSRDKEQAVVTSAPISKVTSRRRREPEPMSEFESESDSDEDESQSDEDEDEDEDSEDAAGNGVDVHHHRNGKPNGFKVPATERRTQKSDIQAARKGKVKDEDELDDEASEISDDKSESGKKKPSKEAKAKSGKRKASMSSSAKTSQGGERRKRE